MSFLIFWKQLQALSFEIRKLKKKQSLFMGKGFGEKKKSRSFDRLVSVIVLRIQRRIVFHILDGDMSLMTGSEGLGLDVGISGQGLMDDPSFVGGHRI